MPPSPAPIRQQALAALTAELVSQGHPQTYAQHMAAAIIFQADLDLCSAQLSRLLAWIQATLPDHYAEALALVESTRSEFEQRIQNG